MKVAAVLIVSLLLAGFVPFAGAQESASQEWVGITKPSRRLALQFYTPGLVNQVKIEEGDLIEVGQVLAVQDDTIEMKQLEGLKVEAESVLTIDAQQKDADQKKVTYDRKQKMYEAGQVASKEELEEAKLQWEIAVIRVDLAKQEHKIKNIEVERQQIKCDLMRLVSPVAGFVERIAVREGEFADINRPEGAVVVAQLDPLWVEIRDLSSAQAGRLKLGQELEIKHELEGTWDKAKVIYFSPVDAASDTRLVRLALPNPNGRTYGFHVQVKLPEGVIEKKDAVGSTR